MVDCLHACQKENYEEAEEVADFGRCREPNEKDGSEENGREDESSEEIVEEKESSA